MSSCVCIRADVKQDTEISNSDHDELTSAELVGWQILLRLLMD